MKKIFIKYNPYFITTDITIDGEKPKIDSALNNNGRRLQEWVEKLPKILLDEYKDHNLEITYKGMEEDYQDLREAFESFDDEKISFKINFIRHNSNNEIEKEVTKIFNQIKDGPIPELKVPEIIQAFEKAQNMHFEINVVATMSSGKSTLINALLGKRIMPSANEATTATIVRVINTDSDTYSAKAYDKDKNIIKEIPNITLKEMKELNGNDKIPYIDIYGKIPFVSNIGMQLVLVDTPGPNNSRNPEHQRITYEMMDSSDKSLVLFVMNGTQLGTNDEAILLDYVCEKIKEGGKKARERILFAANRMDDFDPEEETDEEDDENNNCIESALNNISKALKDRDILAPNIFPICAKPALEWRANLKGKSDYERFRDRVNQYSCFKLENYYHFNHLPIHSQEHIKKITENASPEEIIDIHTGICAIEEAISLYINKYAKATKITDLVQSFNEKVRELATTEKIKDAIAQSIENKNKINQQIDLLINKIDLTKNAHQAYDFIDQINVDNVLTTEINHCTEEIKNKLNRMILFEKKVQAVRAVEMSNNLNRELQAIKIQVDITINGIIKKQYETVAKEAIEKYIEVLNQLDIQADCSLEKIQVSDLISVEITDLHNIIKKSTTREDEGYLHEWTETKTIPSKRKWYNPFSWFEEGEHDVEISKSEWIPNMVEYVDMQNVTNEIIAPFLKSLKGLRTKAIEYADHEIVNLKNSLKEELAKVDMLYVEKLNNLKDYQSQLQLEDKTIKQDSDRLNWLEDIQKQINNLIQF